MNDTLAAYRRKRLVLPEDLPPVPDPQNAQGQDPGAQPEQAPAAHPEQAPAAQPEQVPVLGMAQPVHAAAQPGVDGAENDADEPAAAGKFKLHPFTASSRCLCL